MSNDVMGIDFVDNSTATSTAELSRCVVKSVNDASVVCDTLASTEQIDTLTIDGCTLANMKPVIHAQSTKTLTVTNNVFSGCNQITFLNSMTFEGNTITGYIATEGGGILLDNNFYSAFNGSEPTGLVFSDNDEAVEISTSTYTSWNFDDWSFSDNTADVNNTSGVTQTVYNLNGANASTYTGTLVNFIDQPVTLTVKAVTSTGTPVSGARVLLRASDGTGPFPYQETVTIVNSGTTATVTHTGHGMATNDYVQITGGSLAANEGVFQITVTGANTYTYTMNSSPGSSPTGTISATFVALYGTTDLNGEVTTSRVYSTNQLVTGWVRKSTSSPYYKEGTLTGNVSSSTGYTATAVMILDE